MDKKRLLIKYVRIRQKCSLFRREKKKKNLRVSCGLTCYFTTDTTIQGIPFLSAEFSRAIRTNRPFKSSLLDRGINSCDYTRATRSFAPFFPRLRSFLRKILLRSTVFIIHSTWHRFTKQFRRFTVQESRQRRGIGFCLFFFFFLADEYIASSSNKS